MSPQETQGIVTLTSNHSVQDTVARALAVLDAQGIKLFAVIDHSGEAEKAGLKMPPTKLLIFGSPKAGTPLMLAAPTIAIDLPLKLLIWQDSAAKTWISYNASDYLRARHHLPEDLTKNIAGIAMLAEKAAE